MLDDPEGDLVPGEDINDPNNQDYLAFQKKLRDHANDPYNTELRVNIQALTLERLQEYCKTEKCSIQEAVNDFILSCLYDEGC